MNQIPSSSRFLIKIQHELRAKDIELASQKRPLKVHSHTRCGMFNGLQKRKAGENVEDGPKTQATELVEDEEAKKERRRRRKEKKEKKRKLAENSD